jgi:hypothetical protein
MESARFDGLTRSVSTLLSRRTLAGVFGFGSLLIPSLAEAKKHHKHKHKKKKKVKFNDFGCVNVGGFCKNDDQCCSGICEGKKDKKKCKAHDQGSCQPGQDTCASGTPILCTSSTGDLGECLVTTGNAPSCGQGTCVACSKDADCVPLFGPQAACIVCAACIPDVGTNTGCVAPGPIM